jgi:integrase
MVRTEGIHNLNDLTGRRLYEYRLWRKEDGDLNTTSVRTQLSTLRAFIRFCETIDAVPDNLYEDTSLPALKEGEGVRDVMLEASRAEDILSHLRRFEYASARHVVLEVLWKTGMRTGALHSLDVEDIDAEKRALHLRHRPETGTSLKNGNRGERMVAISEETLQLLQDWIEHSRPKWQTTITEARLSLRTGVGWRREASARPSIGLRDPVPSTVSAVVRRVGSPQTLIRYLAQVRAPRTRRASSPR